MNTKSRKGTKLFAGTIVAAAIWACQGTDSPTSPVAPATEPTGGALAALDPVAARPPKGGRSEVELQFVAGNFDAPNQVLPGSITEADGQLMADARGDLALSLQGTAVCDDNSPLYDDVLGFGTVMGELSLTVEERGSALENVASFDFFFKRDGVNYRLRVVPAVLLNTMTTISGDTGGIEVSTTDARVIITKGQKGKNAGGDEVANCKPVAFTLSMSPAS